MFERVILTRWVHLESLVFLAHIDGWELGLWHGCSVVHQADDRVNVDVVIILRGCRWGPELQKNTMSSTVIRVSELLVVCLAFQFDCS